LLASNIPGRCCDSVFLKRPWPLSAAFYPIRHLYSTRNSTLGRACSTNGGDEECIYDNGGKAGRKETIGRPRRRWVDNIKMDLREILVGWDGIDWIDLAEDRDQWRALVNTVMKLRVP
jgi:hypothetical protein